MLGKVGRLRPAFRPLSTRVATAVLPLLATSEITKQNPHASEAVQTLNQILNIPFLVQMPHKLTGLCLALLAAAHKPMQAGCFLTCHVL